LVAGEMRELGPAAAALHRETGREAGRTGVSRLYACGPFAAELAGGAREAGLAAEAIVTGSREAIAAALRSDLRPGDWVLVKGSRAAGMEAVVAALSQGPAGPEPPSED
jgi:UDP-N-acetylmuramoyl-tripeptide--D-alanyl-D-alanine ligase